MIFFLVFFSKKKKKTPPFPRPRKTNKFLIPSTHSPPTLFSHIDIKRKLLLVVFFFFLVTEWTKNIKRKKTETEKTNKKT